MKCLVKNCENKSEAGMFVGDMCYPCWSFAKTGTEKRSQLYLNALKLFKRNLNKTIDNISDEIVEISRDGNIGR